MYLQMNLCSCSSPLHLIGFQMSLTGFWATFGALVALTPLGLPTGLGGGSGGFGVGSDGSA
jgi:hypothetical protein